MKEDHEVVSILRSLLTDTLCNPPGQERLQPHHRGLHLLLFSSGVGSSTSQKNQISQSAARQTYAFSSLSERTRRSIKSLQMSLQRQHFLPSYLKMKILSVGPAGVWTHDLLLSRPALPQLSQQDGNTSAAQAIVSYVQTDATTPNIVGPTVLEVVVSFCTKLKVWLVANLA